MAEVIVGFSGRKGSGKNTAADYLSEALGKDKPNSISFEIAVASILKRITHKSLGITETESEFLKRTDGVKIANGKDLREFYNDLADAIKDEFGYDAWIKKIISTIDSVREDIEPDLIMVTDVRYPIEEVQLREYCKENDIECYIIKMVNNNHTQRSDNLPVEHESEYLVDQIKEDLLIKANDVQSISDQINKFYNTIKG